jgi:WD40 repeat protein
MAAVIFLVTLVGSMAIVFRSVRHNDEARASACTHNETTTVQSTQPVIHQSKSLGKIVYSTPICPIDGSYIFAPLTWSPYSKRLGVGIENAQSWFAPTGKDVVNYGPNRNASILAVVWSPDGQRIAVTAVSQGIQIFDASTGHLLKTYPDNSQASTVSTTGGYMSLKLPLSGGSGAGATSWSPGGKLMATAFFGSYGRSVQVWNTLTGKLVLNYTGHADVVESISWSADGRYVASSSADGSTQVWNALTGQKTHDFESQQRGGDDVAWSPDGKTIAYFARDQVRVVNPFTGKILVTHISPDDILVWSPDGKSIASTGDHIELWSVATGKTYYTFTKNSQGIKTLAWSPDGNYIASDYQQPPYINATIQVWIAE